MTSQALLLMMGSLIAQIQMGNVEIKAALAAKIPALANDNTTEEGMLCKAAAKGDSTLVRLLLENGTNPNSSIREKNPCVLAMLGSHWDLVKELMAHKNFDFSVEFTDFASIHFYTWQLQ